MCVCLGTKNGANCQLPPTILFPNDKKWNSATDTRDEFSYQDSILEPITDVGRGNPVMEGALGAWCAIFSTHPTNKHAPQKMNRSLTLLILRDTYAVCRLDPTKCTTMTVTEWIHPLLTSSVTTDPSSFLSVTRTNDELSVVCRQDAILSNSLLEHCPIEWDWACIKIQGPLDFTWTGILSSLAKPLAEAAISIFAISTYDTNYILVRQTHLTNAVQVLQQQGHSVQYVTPPLNEE